MCSASGGQKLYVRTSPTNFLTANECIFMHHKLPTQSQIPMQDYLAMVTVCWRFSDR